MSKSPAIEPEASSRGFRRFIAQPSGWQWLTLAIALLVIVPLTVLAFAWAEPAGDIWKHLRETLLSRLLLQASCTHCVLP